MAVIDAVEARPDKLDEFDGMVSGKQLRDGEAEATADMNRVRGVVDDSETDPAIEKALQDRLALMEAIEDQPEKIDRFGRVAQPSKEHEDEIEKALQARMALMEQIEARPEEVDRFGRVAQPSDGSSSQVDKALQDRMALMESIEGEPESIDRFGRRV